MTNTLESHRQHPIIEYHMRTDLPILQSRNTINTIREMEKKTIPKSTEELLELWTLLLESKMKYDAINYALIKEFPINEHQGGWIDKVHPTKLSLSYEQIILIIKTLGEYKKQFENSGFEYTNIELMILSLKNGNFKEFVLIITGMPSLQQSLLSDQEFSKKWMKIYESKGVPELLQMGTGNCKTLALMSKMILEKGNSRWNLGIKKIEIIEQEDNHVVLAIHTSKGIIHYDPMKVLYHQDSKIK